MAVAARAPSSWSPFSIRTVVNSGKICVLNLQPSSLPSIHESDLKPYVVFLTPSSPQMSRQQAAKQGQVFKVTIQNIIHTLHNLTYYLLIKSIPGGISHFL